MDVDAGGSVVFIGDVTGPGDFPGLGDVYFEGDYLPGGSPASVSFAGDVYFSEYSRLVLELGGTVAGDGYDQLLIDGQLTADGLIEMIFIDDFTPSSGQAFDLLQFGSFVGDPTWQFVDLPDGMAWQSTLTNEGMTAIALLLGDFDIDGDVDGTDFLAWQRGESPNPLSSWDLADWQANFGTILSPTVPASALVPKPTALLMLMLGIAAMLFYRHEILS